MISPVIHLTRCDNTPMDVYVELSADLDRFRIVLDSTWHRIYDGETIRHAVYRAMNRVCVATWPDDGQHHLRRPEPRAAWNRTLREVVDDPALDHDSAAYIPLVTLRHSVNVSLPRQIADEKQAVERAWQNILNGTKSHGPESWADIMTTHEAMAESRRRNLKKYERMIACIDSANDSA